MTSLQPATGRCNANTSKFLMHAWPLLGRGIAGGRCQSVACLDEEGQPVKCSLVSCAQADVSR